MYDLRRLGGPGIENHLVVITIAKLMLEVLNHRLMGLGRYLSPHGVQFTFNVREFHNLREQFGQQQEALFEESAVFQGGRGLDQRAIQLRGFGEPGRKRESLIKIAGSDNYRIESSHAPGHETRRRQNRRRHSE
jgi:site-specific recombinase XerC